jgi:hypothetical protein
MTNNDDVSDLDLVTVTLWKEVKHLKGPCRLWSGKLAPTSGELHRMGIEPTPGLPRLMRCGLDRCMNHEHIGEEAPSPVVVREAERRLHAYLEERLAEQQADEKQVVHFVRETPDGEAEATQGSLKGCDYRRTTSRRDVPEVLKKESRRRQAARKELQAEITNFVDNTGHIGRITLDEFHRATPTRKAFLRSILWAEARETKEKGGSA